MDALHNSNECFAIFYSHKTIPWYCLLSPLILNDAVGWVFSLVLGWGWMFKEKALICMQISIYPISAHFHGFLLMLMENLELFLKFLIFVDERVMAHVSNLFVNF